MDYQVRDEEVRVLFVEDDPAVAQMYKLKLELDGYRVEVAGDGELALEIARSSMPDIVFLDLRLPKLDGLGVLEALRAGPFPPQRQGRDRVRLSPPAGPRVEAVGHCG